MNNNTIRARMTVSFKGETYELDSVIDLDECLGEPGEAPNFHQRLARAAGIDPYSYLYEVLESLEIEFSDATGVAAQSCHDGQFDWTRFEQDRREEQDWQLVRAIAGQIMKGRDLDAEPDLKPALLAAYRAGRARGQRA
jgi:phenylalanyl-tRNA synthetase beta subunit